MKRYEHHQWYIFSSCSYYWGYCHYCDFFAGECAAWYIGINRFSAAQGPFCTKKLFGTWPHKVQWCAAGYCSPFLANHFTAATNWTSLWFGLQVLNFEWKWCSRGHARFSLVRTGFAPFLCLRTNWHRVQIVWLCSRVDAGNTILRMVIISIMSIIIVALNFQALLRREKSTSGSYLHLQIKAWTN